MNTGIRTRLVQSIFLLFVTLVTTETISLAYDCHVDPRAFFETLRSARSFSFRPGDILDCKDDSNQNILHVAAKNYSLCLFVRKSPWLKINILDKDSEGMDALALAFDIKERIDVNHLTTIRILLDYLRTTQKPEDLQARLNSTSGQKDGSPLLSKALGLHLGLTILKDMIKMGADPFAPDEQGKSDLVKALQSSNPFVLRDLLFAIEEGMDPLPKHMGFMLSLPNEEGKTPEYWAETNKHHDALRWIRANQLEEPDFQYSLEKAINGDKKEAELIRVFLTYASQASFPEFWTYLKKPQPSQNSIDAPVAPIEKLRIRAGVSGWTNLFKAISNLKSQVRGVQQWRHDLDVAFHLQKPALIESLLFDLEQESKSNPQKVKTILKSPRDSGQYGFELAEKAIAHGWGGVLKSLLALEVNFTVPDFHRHADYFFGLADPSLAEATLGHLKNHSPGPLSALLNTSEGPESLGSKWTMIAASKRWDNSVDKIVTGGLNLSLPQIHFLLDYALDPRSTVPELAEHLLERFAHFPGVTAQQLSQFVNERAESKKNDASVAIEKNWNGVFKKLLEMKLHLGYPDSKGNNVLSQTIVGKKSQFTRLILDQLQKPETDPHYAQAILNQLNVDHNSPLMLALSPFDIQMATQLVEANVNLVGYNNDWNSTLNLAIQSGDEALATSILDRLLKMPPHLQERVAESLGRYNRKNESTLNLAATRGMAELTKKLLHYFPAEEIENSLTRAVQSGSEQTASVLLDHLAETNSSQALSEFISTPRHSTPEGVLASSMTRGLPSITQRILAILKYENPVSHDFRDSKDFRNLILQDLKMFRKEFLEAGIQLKRNGSKTALNEVVHKFALKIMDTVKNIPGKISPTPREQKALVRAISQVFEKLEPELQETSHGLSSYHVNSENAFTSVVEHASSQVAEAILDTLKDQSNLAREERGKLVGPALKVAVSEGDGETLEQLLTLPQVQFNPNDLTEARKAAKNLDHSDLAVRLARAVKQNRENYLVHVLNNRLKLISLDSTLQTAECSSHVGLPREIVGIINQYDHVEGLIPSEDIRLNKRPLFIHEKPSP